MNIFQIKVQEIYFLNLQRLILEIGFGAMQFKER